MHRARHTSLPLAVLVTMCVTYYKAASICFQVLCSILRARCDMDHQLQSLCTPVRRGWDAEYAAGKLADTEAAHLLEQHLLGARNGKVTAHHILCRNDHQNLYAVILPQQASYLVVL